MVKGSDAKANSIKLAKEILGNRDWQYGATKLFLKVSKSKHMVVCRVAQGAITPHCEYINKKAK